MKVPRWHAVLRPFAALRHWLRTAAWFEHFPFSTWRDSWRSWRRAWQPSLSPRETRLELVAFENRHMLGNTLGVLTAPLLGVSGTLLGSAGAARPSAACSAPQTIGVTAPQTPNTAAPSGSVKPLTSVLPNVANQATPVATITGPDSTTAGSNPNDPFASPVADWLGSVDSALARRSNPSSGHAAGGAGVGGNDTANARSFSDQSFGTTMPPVPASTASGDQLWSAVNSLVGGPSLTTGAVTSQPAAGAVASPAPAASAAVTPALGPKYQVPLSFAANVGQTDPSVRYLSQNAGFSVFLTENGATLSFARPGQPGVNDVLKLQLEGANPDPQIVAQGELPSRANYFGGASGQPLTDVAQYSSIVYENVYSGINLVFHSNADNQFEYDFQVSPGADLSQVHLNWQGANGLNLDGQGNLHIQTAGGDIVENTPQLYQAAAFGQQQPVGGGHILLGGTQVGFAAGTYDSDKPLVVDPVIGYGSYLGGSGNDSGNAIAVEPNGTVVIAGSTTSTNFPYNSGVQTTNGGGTDAFVAAFSPIGDGNVGLIYSTYLGGSGTDQANGVAVDPAGNAYVVGTTGSSNFPTTSGAYHTSLQGGTDAFVSKLNPTGDVLVYSSYVGSAQNDTGNAIALDMNDNAYITGSRIDAFSGHKDLTVIKLNAAGSAAAYSYVPASSSGDTTGQGIAVDGSGNAFVTGVTADTGFPVTSGVLQSSLAGTTNAFVLKLNAAGSSRTYATYLGGSGTDSGNAIAIDGSGNAYVAGSTSSTNFPTSAGSYQTSNAGGTDAFIAKLNSTGTTLTYGTYLGGSGTDIATGIAVDTSGYATVAGYTTSTNLPTADALYTSNAGGTDGFVARLNPAGSALPFSTYLGGSSTDQVNGVDLDYADNVYVTGTTNSTNYPVTSATAYQSSNQGGYDAFLTDILMEPTTAAITAISPDTGSSSTDQVTTSQNLTLSGSATPGATVTLSRADVGVLGSVTANATTGAWSYNYTGTTLAEGTYAFTVTQTVAGVTGSASSAFLATVDRTAPTVTVAVPASTTSLGPTVVVTATDSVGLPAGATVSLDVDLLDDGSFSDPGDANYATGTLTNGTVAITLPALPSTGTYRVRARVSDLAGNQGTSSASTFTVSSSGSSWTTTGQVLASDPVYGDPQMQLGDVQISNPLDLDQSPGSDQSGDVAMVYNSGSTGVLPIVQATVQTDNSVALPSSLTATLTWDGTVQGSSSFSTSGFSPGDLLTLAVQTGSSANTVTGRHFWSMQVTMNYGTPITRTVSGWTYTVNENSSPFGPGWTFSGVNQLVSIPYDSTTGAPAGVLEVYGTGGYRFFQQGSSSTTFTSPADDNGILTYSGSAYTYTTPAGDTTTFNNAGYETQWTSADGNETLQYRYDGSNRLTGTTAIDGSASSFTYNGGGLLDHITAPGGRVTSFSYGLSGAVTSIVNPDGGTNGFTWNGYLLVTQQYGSLSTGWAYAAGGTLATVTYGSEGAEAIRPAVVQGLGAPVAATVQGAVRASSTDGLGATTTWELDGLGRALQQWAANGGRTTWTRDGTTGYVSAVTDPDGRTTSYTLDSAGYVLTQTNPDGTTDTSAYQTLDHLLTTYTDERGNTTTYTYDSSGHLLTSTNALTQTTTNTYLSNGLLSSTRDPRDDETSFAYDGERRVTVVLAPLGTGKLTFTYDNNGNLSTTTEPSGSAVSSQYDAMGRLTKTVDAVGDTATIAYDAAGLETGTTDGRGVSTVYHYDGQGSLTETDVAGFTTLDEYDAAGNLTATRDALGNWTYYGYDAVGQRTETLDALDGVSRTYYDLADQVTATEDPLGNRSTQAYNSRGWVTTSTDPLGNSTTYAYDADGDQTSATTPLGYRTTTVYDGLGRATAVTDPTNATTTTTYDGAGNVSTVQDARGNVTSYTYDPLNRPVKVTVAVGAAQQTSTEAYDPNGNVTGVTDALGKTTQYLYDIADRLIRTTDADDNTVSYALNGNGQVTSATDQTGGTTTYYYDNLDRVSHTQDANGNYVHTDFDANGNQVDTFIAGVTVTTYAYDALNRLVYSKTATGGVTSYSYDADGHLTALTDPDNNTTTYSYDRDGRQTKTVSPTTGTTATAYDPDGRAIAVTDGDGRQTLYSYDGDGRKTGAVWKNSGGTTTDTLTYTYDGDGDLLTAANSAGTVAYSYNAEDQIATQTDVFGLTLTYSYDSNNQVKQRQDSLGGVTSYSYDGDGHLTRVQFGGSGLTPVRADLAYNFDNQLSGVKRYSDLAGTSLVGNTTYGYDAGGRVTAITAQDSSATTIAYYNYQYDSANRVTQLTTKSSTAAETFAYDGNGQLVYDSLDASGGTMTYAPNPFSYDVNGNRTMSGYSTGPGNELLGGPSNDYTYDSAGNLIQVSGASTATYTYNNANELTGLTATVGSTVYQETFTYDALGRRVSEQVNGTVTRFALDANGTAWADLTSSNTLVTRYVQSPNGQQYFARIDGSGNVSWLLQAAQGSVRDVLNASGAVVDTVVYDGYGNIRSQTNAPYGGSILYAGYRYDLASNLYLAGARAYDPTTGRWTSPDPLGFGAGQANFYEYCGNSPTNATDPSGMYLQIVAGAVIGAVVGLAAQGVGDLITGHYSGWEAYVGAGLGGAVGGAVFAATGSPLLAGAAAGFVTNSSTQLLQMGSGKRQDFDFGSLVLDTGAGALGGAVGGAVVGRFGTGFGSIVAAGALGGAAAGGLSGGVTGGIQAAKAGGGAGDIALGVLGGAARGAALGAVMGAAGGAAGYGVYKGGGAALNFWQQEIALPASELARGRAELAGAGPPSSEVYAAVANYRPGSGGSPRVVMTAQGPTEIVGNAQTCEATPNHRPTVLQAAAEWVASGEYDLVGMDRNINEYLGADVCDPNIRPDVFGRLRGSGVFDMLEVISESQKENPGILRAKLRLARSQMSPAQRGKISVINATVGP